MHAHKFLLVVAMAGVMGVSADLRADDTPEEAALREALRNSDLTGEFGPVPAPSENNAALIEALRALPETTPATEVSVPPPSGTSGFAPIQSPALPISGTKEEKLNALLIQYKANAITPEQYHTQRAAILKGQ